MVQRLASSTVRGRSAPKVRPARCRSTESSQTQLLLKMLLLLLPRLVRLGPEACCRSPHPPRLPLPPPQPRAARCAAVSSPPLISRHEAAVRQAVRRTAIHGVQLAHGLGGQGVLRGGSAGKGAHGAGHGAWSVTAVWAASWEQVHVQSPGCSSTGLGRKGCNLRVQPGNANGIQQQGIPVQAGAPLQRLPLRYPPLTTGDKAHHPTRLRAANNHVKDMVR